MSYASNRVEEIFGRKKTEKEPSYSERKDVSVDSPVAKIVRERFLEGERRRVSDASSSAVSAINSIDSATNKGDYDDYLSTIETAKKRAKRFGRTYGDMISPDELNSTNNMVSYYNDILGKYNAPYADILNRADFGEKSKYVDDGKKYGFNPLHPVTTIGRELLNNATNNKTRTDKDIKAYYDFINRDINVTGNSIPEMETNFVQSIGSSWRDMTQLSYRLMTEEEKGIFNYLYNSGDIEGANKYLTYLEPTVSKRLDEGIYDTEDILINSAIDKAGFAGGAGIAVASSVLKIGEPALTGANAISNAIGAFNGGQGIDPYAPLAQGTNIINNTRDIIAKRIESETEGADIFGVNVPAFIEQSMQSSLDSVIGGAIYGKGYAPLMGLSAFQSSAKDLMDRGMPMERVVPEAILSGVFEALFEYVSLDRLLTEKNITGVKKLLKDETLFEQDPYIYVYLPGYIYRYKIFSYYKDNIFFYLCDMKEYSY